MIPPSDADQSKTYFRVVLTEYSDSTHSTWQSLPFVVQSSTTVSNVNAVGWIDPGGPGNPLKDYNGNIVYGSASYYDALGRTVATKDPIFNAGGSTGVACSSFGGANATACSVYSIGTITALVSGDTNTYSITTSIDPNNHVQLTYSDALGRVRYVQFDTGANNGTLTANELETIQYNILDEPTSVLVSDLSTQTNESITTMPSRILCKDIQ